MFLRVALAAVVVTLQCACQSSSVASAGLDDADLVALTALDDAALIALETRDWASYRTLVTDDVRWMLRGREDAVGWSEIEPLATPLPPLSTMTHSNRKISGSGNVAYRTVDYVMYFAPVGNEEGFANAGKLLTIYRRTDDGNWLIETEMWHQWSIES